MIANMQAEMVYIQEYRNRPERDTIYDTDDDNNNSNVTQDIHQVWVKAASPVN
jgi:hypothetical protein